MTLAPKAPARIDDPLFHIGCKGSRKFIPMIQTRQEADITILGLSGMYASISTLGGRLKILFWMLATPTGPWRTQVTMAMRLHLPEASQIARWRLMQSLAKVLARLLVQAAIPDLYDDTLMWNHKRHLPHPGLNAKDGPIGEFRRWARQFYPLVDEREDTEPQKQF
ncbi:hypothetical protein C9F11_46930 (plasmid) [Streptomyces sp. YIM 121038]|nr:hypothetical protein C9F11_46930 [Streptomyces sp. YIM 121038]